MPSRTVLVLVIVLVLVSTTFRNSNPVEHEHEYEYEYEYDDEDGIACTKPNGNGGGCSPGPRRNFLTLRRISRTIGLHAPEELGDNPRRCSIMQVGARVAVVGGWAVAMFLAASTLSLARPSTPPTTAATATAPSTLWVLSVGVSHYRDSRLDLRFADEDARSVATALADQAGKRVYDRVESRVLVNDDVRRESILEGIRDFIAQARKDDVATLFLAGHAVRDLLTGTYFFLPNDATPDDFFTRGLRIEELNDLVRILQRHVRHVVVILDTCHAGAAELDGRQMLRADDFAARVRAEGVFLLAATQPGEESKEVRRLGHGVFTYALLNALAGNANAGTDGLLSLAELVIHLGSEVTRLTDGQQTPYYLIAGTDLVFADVRAPNSIVVFPFHNRNRDPRQDDWMASEIQESLHTAMASIPALSLCSLPEEGGTPGPLRARAESLGCGRFVSGSFVTDGDDIVLRARVVDTANEGDEASASVRGPRRDFPVLKAKLVEELLSAMPTVRTFRMMLEAQGIDSESTHEAEDVPGDAPSPPTEEPSSWWHPSWLFVAEAHAQETALLRTPPSTETTLRILLDEYEAAHEAKSIDRIAALWVHFTDKQRAALRRYLDAADDLTLELDDVRIEPHHNDATVALTHIASFVDRESGKPVRLEVRQRILLVRRDGEWKIERIESR